jgi:DNA-binding NtrC family response regulator
VPEFIDANPASRAAIPPLPAGSDGIFPARSKKSPVLRVLVVEDEPLIRWSIAETLAGDGHIVLEAADAATAIRSLTETCEPVDVVLLDFRLPDSNDLTLLSGIRRLSPDSAVVLMTAFGTPEVIQGALDLGAYRVLTKPIDIHDIAALVRDARGALGG